MSLNISIPQLNPKQKTTKDAIISILSQEWPLSAKEIYSRIQRQLSLNVSYQAVHKTITQMEDNETIKKIGREYSLNEEWIKKIKMFAEDLENIYKNKLSEPASLNEKGLTLTFDSLYNFLSGMLEVLETNLRNVTNPKNVAIMFNHIWWSLTFSEKEYRQFKHLVEVCKPYIICKGNTSGDRLVGEFYEKFGGHIKFDINGIPHYDLLVQDDYVISAFLEDNLKQQIEEYYNNLKSLTEVYASDFFDRLFHQKTHIKVIIIKNPPLAEQLRNDVLRYFK